MKRRDFITVFGGAAAAWPLAARAQQPTKTLKVGTVAGTPRSSPQWVAFERRMVELGYQEGRGEYDRLPGLGIAGSGSARPPLPSLMRPAYCGASVGTSGCAVL